MPKLEIVDPTAFIQSELQKSMDLVSFGLQASDSLKTENLEIPGIAFHLTPATDKTMRVEDARMAFRSWILGNGLRDFIDAIGPSLEWARKICFLWTREGEVSANKDGSLHLSAKIIGSDWNELLLKQGQDFEYWPLRKKIDFLHSEYGFTIPELADSILSISYARNCLTHRRGIVGSEDIRGNSQKKLIVRWRKMQLTVLGEKGSRVLEPPAQVQGGEQISFGYSDVTKEFCLGERVEFTPQEFVELATTCLLFALQIQESIRALQLSRKKV